MFPGVESERDVTSVHITYSSFDKIYEENYRRAVVLSKGNPFTPLVGRIDRPDLFFNRKKEIRKVFELLNSGASVSIIGASGIGKSSLLMKIKGDEPPIFMAAYNSFFSIDFHHCPAKGLRNRR